jgi:hypothetical protein
MKEPVLKLDDRGRREAARIVASNERVGMFPHNEDMERAYADDRRTPNVEIDRLRAKKGTHD